ncbi:MAG: nucleoside-diphosphate kinase [Armatimonadota bacterium]|nr:nucleoside-diphosphate kinase [Armatimonadota bacterium]MDR7422634.1 nucleoside-diphosphate kinase [Armatimonadota bacterium]MDR7454447.1 nucleoside-diphosphate kinase [Armatimonadota bacterium]MDR7457374.1 nucleoside-diphosphate kinase [Armatimonadota bacterium]MDR7496749.1 nucleoside-diphosphate kinase [Armatimonadota bacterium]
MTDARHERTLVFLKPDGVQRGLIGEVLGRFERAGLKVVGLKMVRPTAALLERHYPSDEGFLRTLGTKTREAFEAAGRDVTQETGTDDTLVIGRQVRQWLIDFVASAPVAAFVLEGTHAVAVTRKLVGDTLPFRAAPGTIRGDLSADSPTVANLQKRPVRNLVHASGTLEEAAFEIGLWFAAEELHDYRRVDEGLVLG